MITAAVPEEQRLTQALREGSGSPRYMEETHGSLEKGNW